MEANKIAYMNASLIAGFFEKKFINPSRSERICIDDLKKKEKSFIWKTEIPTSVEDIDSSLNFIKKRKDETFKVLIKEIRNYTYSIDIFYRIYYNNGNNWDDGLIFYRLSNDKDMAIKKILDDIFKDIPTPDRNEATKIILEETKLKLFPKLPNDLHKIYFKYSVDIGHRDFFIRNLWNIYIKHNATDYDKTYFALIATKSINETIDWNFINDEIKKYFNEETA